MCDTAIVTSSGILVQDMDWLCPFCEEFGRDDDRDCQNCYYPRSPWAGPIRDNPGCTPPSREWHRSLWRGARKLSPSVGRFFRISDKRLTPYWSQARIALSGGREKTQADHESPVMKQSVVGQGIVAPWRSMQGCLVDTSGRAQISLATSPVPPVYAFRTAMFNPEFNPLLSYTPLGPSPEACGFVAPDEDGQVWEEARILTIQDLTTGAGCDLARSSPFFPGGKSFTTG